MDTDILHILEANKHLGFLLNEFGEFGGLSIFFGTLLFGEVVILVSFLFSGPGTISFLEVFIFSFLAVWCADSFWLLIGRYLPLNNIPDFFKSSALRTMSEAIKVITKDKLLFSIIVLKFFIGARIAYMIYLGRQNIPLGTVLIYNMIAIFLFVSVLSIIGTVSGHYIKEVFNSYQYLVSALFGVTFFVIVLTFTKTALRKIDSPL